MRLWIRVSLFTFIEDKLSYTSKESLGKHIQSKDITLWDGYQMKEIKKMLDDENDTQVHKFTGGQLKNKGMPSDRKTITGKYLRCNGINRED